MVTSVHNKNWLRYLAHTTPQGCDAEIMARENCLTQLINEPAHISSVEGLQQNTLDILLTASKILVALVLREKNWKPI